MEKKKESTLIRLMLSLSIIAVAAGIALGIVYSVTKEPIEQAQVTKKNTAINKVLPDFTGEVKEVSVQPEDGKDPIKVYLAYKNDGQLYGAAVETYTDIAFSGRFTIMVGLDAKGTIIDTEVIEMSETPGLGDKIDKNNDPFSEQFNGKNPATASLKVTQDGGEIDAITAATISSRAFCDAVMRAYDVFLKAKEM